MSLHCCFTDRILAGLPVVVTPTLLYVDDDDDRVVELSAVVVENVADDVEFECTDEVPLDVPDACTDVDVALEVPVGKTLDDDDVGIVWLTSESGTTG